MTRDEKLIVLALFVGFFVGLVWGVLLAT